MSAVTRVRILAFTLLMLAGWLGWSGQALAHAELSRADPPPDGLLAAPPREIALWFTEAIATGGGSPDLRVVDATGRELPASNLRVDKADPRHLVARLDGAPPGTYTVIWRVRSAADGHTLTGSYAFRIGGGQAPGAATVEGEKPATWAMATRWLSFLGAALAAAGLGLIPFLLDPDSSEMQARRRRTISLAGAGLGLLATVTEVVGQWRWPPAGVLAPDLTGAISSMPGAWWLRPAGLLVALMCAAGLRRASEPRDMPVLAWLGTGASLGALLGLSLTSHAAARASWRVVATSSDVLHLWAVALWTGGLLHLAALWPTLPSPLTMTAVRRFSRVALVLAMLGIGTGVVNAGIGLPSLASLWSSLYGEILVLKLAVLLPVLVLATFHRAAIRRAVQWIERVGRRTVRIEAALVVLVVLGGSSLALAAPPQPEVNRTEALVLAQPVDAAPVSSLQAQLELAPASPGANRIVVRLRDDGQPLADAKQPAVVRLRLVSLEHPVETAMLQGEPAAPGDYAIGPVTVGIEGWWRAELLLRWLGQPDIILPFYFVLPDPNVHGMDAIREQPTDAAAAAVYARGMASMTGWHRVRYRQLTSDGRGLGVVMGHEVNDGADGSPPGYHLVIKGRSESVVLGTRGWSWRAGEGWTTFETPPMVPPARWDDEYEGATGFRLGRVETVNGEPCQIVTFVVPATAMRAVAWYIWWVGIESGQLYRDVMISRIHYMVNDFTDFDGDIVIQPPAMTADGG